MRVRVEQTLCRGHALCIAALPEIFRWADERQRAFTDDEPVPAELESDVLFARDNCPTQAIAVDGWRADAEHVWIPIAIRDRLSTEKRAQIIGCLVEGMSMRAIARTAGVSRNTIDKLLGDLGEACADFQDGALTDLDVKRVEADEIWSFCYSKQKNVPEEFRGTPGYGDVWTWVAIDADTKLVPSWLLGEHTTQDCWVFLSDLKSRIRIGNRIQLTTDGFGSYPPVVDSLWRNAIDYAQVIKEYTSPTAEDARKYSPSTCTSIQKEVVSGNPDLSKTSNSYVERQNLTMRMGMRRFTRLTNAFSKKVENHAHATSLHFMHYNFCRPHQTLTKKVGKPTTPAMAAGVAKYPWSLTQLAELLD